MDDNLITKMLMLGLTLKEACQLHEGIYSCAIEGAPIPDDASLKRLVVRVIEDRRG